MAKLKTQPNDDSVEAFVAAIADQTKREDAATLTGLMSAVTGLPPTMWGDAMVGFGSYDYTYASGRTGVWFAIGFSPRKQSLTIYLMDGFEKYESLLAKLGKHSVSKSCLYIKRLSDVDMTVLEQLVRRSFRAVSKSP